MFKKRSKCSPSFFSKDTFDKTFKDSDIAKIFSTFPTTRIRFFLLYRFNNVTRRLTNPFDIQVFFRDSVLHIPTYIGLYLCMRACFFLF